MGATGRSPVELEAGGTPLTRKEHLPSSSCILENLDCLAERFGTLGLQVTSRNRCSAVEKRARKAKPGEALTEDFGSSQPRSAQGGQLHTSQTPRTSGTYQRGLGSTGPKSPKSKRHSQGPGKWEGSRLKTAGLEALPTYRRVAAWFPGPEDTERYCYSSRG
jgi:hypothetical protein